MKENKINATIAITCLIAAVLMTFALSFAIGKWSWSGGAGNTYVIQFPNATGVTGNTTVKYAGAAVGRVLSVKLIPREQRTLDPMTHTHNVINVTIKIDADIPMTADTKATIMQDGIGIAAKYLLLVPGEDENAPLLASGATMQGDRPFDVTDLLQPAGDMLHEAQSLVHQLQPVIQRVDNLSVKLATDLPPMIDHADQFLQNGNGVMANLNTPEGRARINEMLNSLRVSTENLKVVSTNAKALTATLAEKPWRVFWGGPTVTPPTEDEVLKSDKVIRLKPEVDVNAAPSSKKKSSSQ